MDRIAQLKSFVQEQPDNPFPRYGLALEYRNTGKLEQAQKVFDELAEKFPDYLAAYLMAGNNLVDLERAGDAGERFKRGIEVAQKQGNGHAKAELETALADLDNRR